MLFAEFEKSYRGGPIIHGNLGNSLQEFKVGALFGPSGCGKTTILRCLAGLEKPQRGTIHFQDEVWFDHEKKIFLPPQKRGVGFLFQDYALFPHLTVAANISYGLHFLDKKSRKNRVGEMLDFFRLHDLGERYPAQISGGQQQRVALARAVVLRPRLLLLDEPLSALDTPTRDELRLELQKYVVNFKTPAIVVTHDRLEVMTLADHMTVLENGRILQSGPTYDVFKRPANLAVARIVGVETVELAQVLKVEDGLATLKLGETELVALTSGELSSQTYICIRAEDVLLQKEINMRHTSARNQITGAVQGLWKEGPLVRVSLDCGFTLTALVTQQASEELELKYGQNVTALLKAPAIHLLPGPPVKV